MHVRMGFLVAQLTWQGETWKQMLLLRLSALLVKPCGDRQAG